MASENVIEIHKDNWKEEVLDSSTTVLVDFWAEWCGPCKAIGPSLDELASELDGKLKVAKVNVDENQNLAAEFEVRSIPSLFIFKNGAIADRMVGAMSKQQLSDAVSPHI